MKKLISIIVLLTFVSLSTFSQSKKMQNSIDSCRQIIGQQSAKIALLEEKIDKLYSILTAMKTNASEPSNDANHVSASKSTIEEVQTGQCKAYTQAGSLCKRNASTGSDYCWQHQSQSSTVSGSSSSSTSSMAQPSQSSSYSGDRKITTGSRGGQYYINKNGNKTYVKRK